ncbi:MAG: ATP-binding cassette domain-containing protein [Clostridia bacterium]|nr:ATP-binding cassette domain-containing protein [Clostridia bacterium]
MIELKKVCKTYSTAGGSIVALKDIDLTIKDGDVYGIIGLSGAGKSTLVRCINLLERPTSGEVVIDGENILAVKNKRLLEIRRKIGMIFQNFNLLEQRTVEGNVKFPLEISGVDKKTAEKRVDDLLNMVGLADRKRSYPSQLSGGQKQRVAIARALATEPKCLLCDEATSALDPATTLQILDLLKKINATLGVTVIVITHEMKVIENVCTKVAVIDKSVIAEKGSVAEIFANPKSDIARKLIIPDLIKSVAETDGIKFRLVFDGEQSERPIVAGLALETGVAPSIMFADTRNIGGKAFGHMVISVTDGNADAVEKVENYLKSQKIKYFKENA